MFQDEFKERYTTIPFAIYQACRVCGGKEVIAHQHKEIELISMTEGAAAFYVNSHPYPMKKGDVLVIPPYAIHRAQTAKGTITSYDCICFDLRLLCDEALKKELEGNMFSAEHLVGGETPDTAHLAALIHGACAACSGNQPGWELEAVGNMSLLFAVLKKNACFSPALQDKNGKDFARAAMAYIADKFAEPITSRIAADALHMSQSYFCRLFKQVFGCRFEKYILAYRLEKARIDLMNTKLPVTQIAFQTGFNSCSYFGKMFKEKYGVTPLAYRKSAGK